MLFLNQTKVPEIALDNHVFQAMEAVRGYQINYTAQNNQNRSCRDCSISKDDVYGVY